MENNAHKTPEFLAMHPFGQLPVIDDEGFIIYETRAICRYLAEKYADQGPSLLPMDLKGRALFEQAVSVESANFYPHAMKAVTETLINPHHGVPTNQTALAHEVSELSAKLEVYNVILEKQKFLAGDQYTLADIFHLSYAPFLAAAGIDVMTNRPNVARWWKEVISRPAWIKLQEQGIKSTAD
ncbi:glutathione S-transferase [Mycena crocata]|nr:glutathione S-transferase [Mycena crocata]